MYPELAPAVPLGLLSVLEAILILQPYQMRYSVREDDPTSLSPLPFGSVRR